MVLYRELMLSFTLFGLYFTNAAFLVSGTPNMNNEVSLGWPCSTNLTADNITFYNPSSMTEMSNNLEMHLNSPGRTDIFGNCGNIGTNTTIISLVSEASNNSQPYEAQMDVLSLPVVDSAHATSDLSMKTNSCGEACYVNNNVYYSSSEGNLSISISASDSELHLSEFYPIPSSAVIANSTGKGNKFQLMSAILNSLTVEGFMEVILDLLQVQSPGSLTITTHEDYSSVWYSAYMVADPTDGSITKIKHTGRNSSTKVFILMDKPKCYRILYTDGANTKITIGGVLQNVSVGAGELTNTTCEQPFLEIVLTSGTVELGDAYDGPGFDPFPSIDLTKDCIYPTLENIYNYFTPSAIPPCSAPWNPNLNVAMDINGVTGEQTLKRNSKGDPGSTSSSGKSFSVFVISGSLSLWYMATMIL
eukprot:Nk52_evm18s153 gene=Nk52_evmTU18s153